MKMGINEIRLLMALMDYKNVARERIYIIIKNRKIRDSYYKKRFGRGYKKIPARNRHLNLNIFDWALYRKIKDRFRKDTKLRFSDTPPSMPNVLETSKGYIVEKERIDNDLFSLKTENLFYDELWMHNAGNGWLNRNLIQTGSNYNMTRPKYFTKLRRFLESQGPYRIKRDVETLLEIWDVLRYPENRLHLLMSDYYADVLWHTRRDDRYRTIWDRFGVHQQPFMIEILLKTQFGIEFLKHPDVLDRYAHLPDMYAFVQIYEEQKRDERNDTDFLAKYERHINKIGSTSYTDDYPNEIVNNELLEFFLIQSKCHDDTEFDRHVLNGSEGVFLAYNHDVKYDDLNVHIETMNQRFF